MFFLPVLGLLVVLELSKGLLVFIVEERKSRSALKEGDRVGD